ncbi:MAG: hypothetical protein N0C90_22415, partial [Candidatus Thiodiazotropha endolucinida]|nr:hypothetical protein [Candidatus Thiodiazotropha taylori]MCW4264110.1 hypothetical protein [Candidatus Thiodiazotropha endolucinida]
MAIDGHHRQVVALIAHQSLGRVLLVSGRLRGRWGQGSDRGKGCCLDIDCKAGDIVTIGRFVIAVPIQQQGDAVARIGNQERDGTRRGIVIGDLHCGGRAGVPRPITHREREGIEPIGQSDSGGPVTQAVATDKDLAIEQDFTVHFLAAADGDLCTTGNRRQTVDGGCVRHQGIQGESMIHRI